MDDMGVPLFQATTIFGLAVFHVKLPVFDHGSDKTWANMLGHISIIHRPEIQNDC